MNAPIRFDRIEDFTPALLHCFGRSFGPNESTIGDIALDITENEADYDVRAAIPVAKKDDIRVSVDGNSSPISARIKSDKEEEKSDRVVVREVSYGRGSRRFSLAHDIDAGRVEARLQDGVLKLTLPKRAGTTERAIAVK